jgi:ABC-type bacteriocin/lantibiotic exporter with double-glycine peptidase domain
MTDVQNSSNFISVPLCYQETDYHCGVACVQSLLACYGMHYTQRALTDILNPQPILGTDYHSIVFLMQLHGLKASMIEDMEIDDIKNYIDVGITPILMIQAWKIDDIEYPCDWKDGHYIIVCGYYDDGIYAMDPYMFGNYTYLPFSELSKRWHVIDPAGVRHLCGGLIVRPEACTVQYHQNAIKHLD